MVYRSLKLQICLLTNKKRDPQQFQEEQLLFKTTFPHTDHMSNSRLYNIYSNLEIQEIKLRDLHRNMKENHEILVVKTVYEMGLVMLFTSTE